MTAATLLIIIILIALFLFGNYSIVYDKCIKKQDFTFVSEIMIIIDMIVIIVLFIKLLVWLSTIKLW